jgi:hypothetical protein
MHHPDKHTCNMLLIKQKHTCITIATYVTSWSTFATSIWNTCNIPLKQTLATCAFKHNIYLQLGRNGGSSKRSGAQCHGVARGMLAGKQRRSPSELLRGSSEWGMRSPPARRPLQWRRQHNPRAATLCWRRWAVGGRRRGVGRKGRIALWIRPSEWADGSGSTGASGRTERTDALF